MYTEIEPWPRKWAFLCVAEVIFIFKPHLSFPCPRSAILRILDLGLSLLLAPIGKFTQQRLCGGYRGSQRKQRFVRSAKKITRSIFRHYVISLAINLWYLIPPIFQEMATAIAQSLHPKQLQKCSPDVETAPWANHQSAASTGQR